MSIPNAFDPLGNRGFTRVQYLQSTGIQWIDTRIKPSEFDEFEIQYKVTINPQDGGNFFGVDDTVSTRNLSKSITAYRGGMCWFGYGSVETVGGDTNKITTYRIDSTTAYLTCNGGTKTLTKSGEVLDVSMHLFRANGAAKDTSYKDTGLQIFYAWFKKDGNLLAHFVPAIDPKGVACMLELVSGVPYYNQGTGEFICG